MLPAQAQQAERAGLPQAGAQQQQQQQQRHNTEPESAAGTTDGCEARVEGGPGPADSQAAAVSKWPPPHVTSIPDTLVQSQSGRQVEAAVQQRPAWPPPHVTSIPDTAVGFTGASQPGPVASAAGAGSRQGLRGASQLQPDSLTGAGTAQGGPAEQPAAEPAAHCSRGSVVGIRSSHYALAAVSQQLGEPWQLTPPAACRPCMTACTLLQAARWSLTASLRSRVSCRSPRPPPSGGRVGPCSCRGWTTAWLPLHRIGCRCAAARDPTDPHAPPCSMQVAQQSQLNPT